MSDGRNTFKAYLFHPEIGNEVIEGNLLLDRHSVRFQSNQLNDEIPEDRMSIWFEGEESDRIVFGDAARPDLKIFSDDGAILNFRSLARLNLAREQLTRVATRREMSRRTRLIFYFFSACVLFFWMGSCSVSHMVRSLAAKVPREWEQEFSQAQLDLVRQEGVLRTNTPQVAELNALAKLLTDVLPPGKREFRFFILEDDTPNAFALPNGYVVVHSGLIDMVDRPEELLGVIAHEVAHVTKRHAARQTIGASGPFVIFGVFLHSRSGIGNVLALGTGLMVYQGFSQEYETEADNTGWDYLVSARINPHGMISMFQKMRAYEAAHEFADILPEAFHSHPALEKRIGRLQKKWRKVSNNPSGFVQVTNQLADLRSR